MGNPLFSVILATYNRKTILLRAIQSVLEQTLGDFELLIMDNGSTDGTESVVRGIKDDRVLYNRNPMPTNSCDVPRNMGIKIAKGRFISFLDDDDVWYYRKLEKVKEAFDRHPEAAAVCHYEDRSVNGSFEGVMRHGPWVSNFYERLLYEKNSLSPSAITIEASALRRFGGFDEREEFSEVADYDLWIRMAREGAKIYFIEESLGKFHLTASNWSVVNPWFYAKLASLLKMHIIAYENKPLLQVSKDGLWRLFQLYSIAGQRLMRAGRLQDALPYFIMNILFIARRPALSVSLCSKLKKKRK